MANTVYNSQVFLTSGTFVAPATTVMVSMCGGGGGGTSLWGLGGGGANAVYRQVVTGLTIGQSIPITVGYGGTPGYGPINTTFSSSAWETLCSAYSCCGGDGGSSAFGSYITATGGKGGKATASSANVGYSGGVGGTWGGLPAIADIGISGSNVDKLRTGGDGGDCLFGVGGRGGQYVIGAFGSPLPGGNGAGYGSGGGGGSDWLSPGGNVYKATAGGSGAPGLVIVEW